MKIEKKSLKISQFLPHFMNLNHILKKNGRTRAGYLFSIWFFSECTCSGVSKIRNQKILRALLGQQVSQHDVLSQQE
jgi:hypothetical protein